LGVGEVFAISMVAARVKVMEAGSAAFIRYLPSGV
jgi:hypothetical protein